MKALRVLLVEDEANIASLFAEVLASLGHDVCSIEATEAAAITAAARCRPDLMIVDVRLGVGSGVTAVAEILLTGYIPHVFVSGDTAIVHALRPGAIALQKPFFASDLVRAIRRALSAAPC
jgi:DNA-binding NtrC family response regulator